MTYSQIRKQLIDIVDKNKDQGLELEVSSGSVEVGDSEGFSKLMSNGTMTVTLKINGGAKHEGEI